MGYHSQIILNGRIVNDGMAEFVAHKTVKKMVQAGLAPKKSRVVMLGLTFKENCPDVRNSRVADIVSELGKYGIETAIVDPWADPDAAKKVYGLTLTPMDEIRDADCVVVAVAHREFCELGVEALLRLFGRNDVKILIDIKGIFDINELKKSDIIWWRL